jgi:hypothetical protein
MESHYQNLIINFLLMAFAIFSAIGKLKNKIQKFLTDHPAVGGK